MATFSRGEWIAISGIIGLILAIMIAVMTMLYVQYQILSDAEDRLETKIDRVSAELKAEMAELRAEMKAEMTGLRADMVRLAESMDSRLDEVEREQVRLAAVNDLLAQRVFRE